MDIMENTMIKFNPKHGAPIYTTCPTKNTEKMIDLFKDAPNFESAETFASDSMKLEDLPADVQDRVKQLLKMYSKAHVVYEYGKFEASAHHCLKAGYHYDRFWCGEYKAEDVYTKEERRQHLAELNSHEFPEWAW
jgi:hypothetical protein